MLEYIKLSIQNALSGVSTLSIWHRDGRLRFSYDHAEGEVLPPLIVRVPQKTADWFLTEIDSLNIRRLKKAYLPRNWKEDSEARERWYLLYKEEDQPAVESAGIDTYPRKWSKLLDLITSLVNEAESEHLDRLSRVEILFSADRNFKSGRTDSYREILSVDRTTQNVLYSRYFGGVTSVKFEYHVPEIIDYLLGNAERYFKDLSRFPDSPAKDGQPSVSVVITERNGRQHGLNRSYDRHGIPDDWNELLEDFCLTMNYYGVFGSMFDPGLYCHGVKNGELIYLSCIFKPNGKSYYYRTTDDTLAVGDLVLVPTKSRTEQEKVVMVSAITYCTAENAPYPPEKTRMIIGRLVGDDIFPEDEPPEDLF